MNYRGIDFNIITPFPTFNNSPAGMSPASINQFIGHEDTVKMWDKTSAANDRFLGMVMTVRHSLDTSHPFHNVARHPACLESESGLELLVRLFVIHHDGPFPTHIMGTLDKETTQACSGMIEVVRTNCILWVTPNLI